MNRAPTKRQGRLWVWLPGSLLLAIAILAAWMVWQPYFFIERATDLFLARNNVRQSDVTVDHHRIHYLEAKPTAAGPDKPVLLIHGLGARASDWGELVPQLATHGYHVYALDLLGYGRSEKPMSGDFSLATEERIVSGFARELHIQRPDVLGWSMGGWIAIKYALDEPQNVRRLAVFDSAGMYMPLNFSLDLFTPTTRAGFMELNRMIEPDTPRLQVPGWVVPGLLRQFGQNRRIVESSVSSMLDGREILDFKLYRLSVPMLLVWGTQDKLTPMQYGLRMHELVPQSVFVGIDGCGHLTIAECSHTAIPETLRYLDADPPLTQGTHVLVASPQVASLVLHAPAVAASLRQADVLQNAAAELGRHLIDRLRPVVERRYRGEDSRASLSR